MPTNVLVLKCQRNKTNLQYYYELLTVKHSKKVLCSIYPYYNKGNTSSSYPLLVTTFISKAESGRHKSRWMKNKKRHEATRD